MELFWDVLASQVGEGYFTIYYAMERSGPFVALGTAPNLPSYGKKSILLKFLRSSQGMGEENSFYVAGTYTDGSMVTSPMGDLKFVPAVVSQAVAAGAANSPITVSERYQLSVGATPVRLQFSADAKQIEVFNLNKTAEIYVDVTGLDASVSKSMPVMPYGYYALGVHVSKNTGISMVSVGGPNDVRIVVHY